jgi:hypothetical protein
MKGNTGNTVADQKLPITKSDQNPVQPASDNSRFERALKVFNSGIKRAENLLSIDDSSTGKKLSITKDKLHDSYRAVIVLSISALDSFIKTYLGGEIKICLERGNLSSNLKQYIKEELYSKDKDALLNSILEPDFYDKVLEKIEEDFKNKSFQGQKLIDKYMKLAGVEQVFKQISKSANVSADNLQSDLETYTQRRHLIVHCGDHDLSQTEPTENKITKKEAQNCVKLVKLIAEEIHKMKEKR